MSVVAILGAGAGGASAVTELTRAGHAVRLWNRSATTLEPFQRRGAVGYRGVFGEGEARPELITTDLRAACEGADAVLVTLPTLVHGRVADAMVAAGLNHQPVVLNPGHTGGALEFHQRFIAAGVEPPPIAEFSTLTYVARKSAPDTVNITGAAKQVRVAAMPGGGEALLAAHALYPGAAPLANVLGSSLANVNLVLHPPGSVLGLAWVEASGGDFTFYVQGMTPGVGRVMAALDRERRTVALAFGHDLPPLIGEMVAIGTVEPEDADKGLVEAISGGRANSTIKAPHSMEHRYYREDFAYGLLPFTELAAIAGVQVPVAQGLLDLGVNAAGTWNRTSGRTAAAMGVAELDRDALLQWLGT